MVDDAYLWLKAHPLSAEVIIGLTVGLILLLLTPVLSPMVNTFWRFCAIPPQRLNIWILKARLAGAVSQRRTFRRVTSDSKYVIYICFKAGFYAIFFITFCVATFSLLTMKEVRDASHVPIRLDYQLSQWVVGFTMALAFGILFRITSDFVTLTLAVQVPHQHLDSLTAKITKLRSLVDRANAVDPGGDTTHLDKEP
ncbi:hypothetical protein P8935_01240 [Telmatobacter sp. DSM 110680]|uniref:Uncharacterized protein n=1 Tax=Telmatobacter sp. DSM 110680 TaxID=3036704 RepID=A0AAU7DLM1_9BACT